MSVVGGAPLSLGGPRHVIREVEVGPVPLVYRVDEWGTPRPFARPGDVVLWATRPEWALKELAPGVQRAPLARAEFGWP